jgi:small membrane protein
MIKVILIAATVGFGVYVLRDAGTGKLLAVRRLAGLAFVVAAVAAVLFPDALTWVANRVGVGRGTDLLTYGLVVAYLFTTAATYQRIHHLESQITRLAREQALQARPDATSNESLPSASTP